MKERRKDLKKKVVLVLVESWPREEGREMKR